MIWNLSADIDGGLVLLRTMNEREAESEFFIPLAGAVHTN